MACKTCSNKQILSYIKDDLVEKKKALESVSVRFSNWVGSREVNAYFYDEEYGWQSEVPEPAEH